MRSSVPTIVRLVAALAAGMGIGRFVYTPILPLMQTQTGMSAETASALATANYVGYLLGAGATIALPRVAASRRALRLALLAVTASMAAMPLVSSAVEWSVLRAVGGAASAVVFVVAMTALVRLQSGPARRWAGAGVGGVGLGIALSASALLGIQGIGDWTDAWFVGAAVSAALTSVAWPIRLPASAEFPPVSANEHGNHWFWVLFVSYTLEGIGYIIAGTFLVAAVVDAGPAWLGNGAWLIVGMAAAISPPLWFGLSARRPLQVLLLIALIAQAAGIALPALLGGVGPALAGAALFGGTFLAIAAMSANLGGRLRAKRAVPILTTGYSVGQILGPVVVTPFVGTGGYRAALLVGAWLVALSAVTAGVLCKGYRGGANESAS
jgi:MFS family permease